MRFVIRAINFFLIRFLSLKIIQSDDYKKSLIKKEYFPKVDVKKSNNGYFYLDPMPEDDNLSEYYEKYFWYQDDFSDIVNLRDCLHLNMIKHYLCNKLQPGNTFLNFGSGKGGISHLVWQEGLKVTNVDLFQQKVFSYQRRWVNHRTLQEVKTSSIDIFYACHSLEHVNDLDRTISEIRRVVKQDGFVFFEVPNADYELFLSGSCRMKIPHTYYFQKSFFKDLLMNVKLLESSNSKIETIDSWESTEGPEDNIIRAIGKIAR